MINEGILGKWIVPAVYKDQQDNLSGDESDFYQVMTDK